MREVNVAFKELVHRIVDRIKNNAEIVELIGRMPRINDYTAGRISIKTYPKIQQGRKEEGIWSWRSGTSNGSKEYGRCQRREVSTDLGRTL